MTRFAGVLGYGERVEFPAPGSGDWKNVITEHKYYGKVVRNSRRLQEDGEVNKNLTLQNSIEIVANPYARDNMDKLLYVKLRGNRWNVDECTEITGTPRLLLRLGTLYNGEVPSEPTP